MSRPRIYVAGAFSDPNVIQIFMNMNHGIRTATELLLDGFAPYCPWIDYQFYLNLRPGEEITIEEIYEYSIVWLEACEAVLVVPGWENSFGTKREIERANELDIPVYFNQSDLYAAYDVPQYTLGYAFMS